ncbi:MAG: hypothetical protein ABI128_07045 [Rhodanobacter sp.]
MIWSVHRHCANRVELGVATGRKKVALGIGQSGNRDFEASSPLGFDVSANLSELRTANDDTVWIRQL